MSSGVGCALLIMSQLLGANAEAPGCGCTEGSCCSTESFTLGCSMLLDQDNNCASDAKVCAAIDDSSSPTILGLSWDVVSPGTCAGMTLDACPATPSATQQGPQATAKTGQGFCTTVSSEIVTVRSKCQDNELIVQADTTNNPDFCASTTEQSILTEQDFQESSDGRQRFACVDLPSSSVNSSENIRLVIMTVGDPPCQSGQTTPPPPTPSPIQPTTAAASSSSSGGDLPWWAYLLIALGICFCCLICCVPALALPLMGIGGRKKKESSRTSRSSRSTGTSDSSDEFGS